MGSIKVILPDELEKEFREWIYRSKGMRKGNITEAVKEAIRIWIEEEKKKLAEEAVDLKTEVEEVRHPQEKKRI